MVLSGATTSSLGIRVLRQDPRDPLGTMWGTPLDIRSDEFLTGTSAELNVLALGHSSSSPLSHSPDLVIQVASGQPFETIFFFEGNLLRLGPWLPDTMLFAAAGRSRSGAGADRSTLVAAARLQPAVVVAAATRWSCWRPPRVVVLRAARVLSFASLGCLLLVVAADAGPPQRPPGPGRPPSSWPRPGDRAGPARHVLRAVEPDIGVPVVLAVGVWLVIGAQRRAGLVVLGVGPPAAAAAGREFWENADAVVPRWRPLPRLAAVDRRRAGVLPPLRGAAASST